MTAVRRQVRDDRASLGRALTRRAGTAERASSDRAPLIQEQIRAFTPLATAAQRDRGFDAFLDRLPHERFSIPVLSGAQLSIHEQRLLGRVSGLFRSTDLAGVTGRDQVEVPSSFVELLAGVERKVAAPEAELRLLGWSWHPEDPLLHYGLVLHLAPAAELLKELGLTQANPGDWNIQVLDLPESVLAAIQNQLRGPAELVQLRTGPVSLNELAAHGEARLMRGDGLTLNEIRAIRTNLSRLGLELAGPTIEELLNVGRQQIDLRVGIPSDLQRLASPTQSTDTTRLDVLGLTAPTIDRLNEAGIHTIGELNNLSTADLIRLGNLTISQVREIEEALD